MVTPESMEIKVGAVEEKRAKLLSILVVVEVGTMQYGRGRIDAYRMLENVSPQPQARDHGTRARQHCGLYDDRRRGRFLEC
jgi:hypothetical protein